MGYVTASTNTTSVSLTVEAREDIVKSVGFNIKFFILGDTDTNYALTTDLTDTVDVRGEVNECLKGTSSKSIKHKILSNHSPNEAKSSEEQEYKDSLINGIINSRG